MNTRVDTRLAEAPRRRNSRRAAADNRDLDFTPWHYISTGTPIR